MPIKKIHHRRLRPPELYEIAIPTRGRPGQITTIDALGINPQRYTLFVDTEEEAFDYGKHYPDVRIVVTEVKGITNTRNFILDYYPSGSHIVTMCDDVQEILMFSGSKKLVPIYGNELDVFIRRGFEVCIHNNTKLWGVYPIPNHFFMKKTLSPDGFIIGTFSGIIVSDIRMDEELILKEDYDFTIKHILEYRKVVRFNYVAVKAKHYKNKGGCVDYRTTEAEQKSIARLKELYPRFVRDNPKRENEILLKFPKRRR